ncbi:hypothetical protein CRM22_003457 [Opisthorchis felineus]|uniref:Uncharacterized protein n=1 Tax=Opisthorchis felineus TaxID=147828 RepID=A0A4S2M134_OPIFE|nr:hypothetical protein CRM22_003457 [Opisthorchis felineus]
MSLLTYKSNIVQILQTILQSASTGTGVARASSQTKVYIDSVCSAKCRQHRRLAYAATLEHIDDTMDERSVGWSPRARMHMYHTHTDDRLPLSEQLVQFITLAWLPPLQLLADEPGTDVRPSVFVFKRQAETPSRQPAPCRRLNTVYGGLSVSIITPSVHGLSACTPRSSNAGTSRASAWRSTDETDDR